MDQPTLRNAVGVLSAVLLGLAAYGLGQATSSPTVAVSDVTAAPQAGVPAVESPSDEPTQPDGEDPSPSVRAGEGGTTSPSPSPNPTPQPAARIPTFDKASESGTWLVLLGIGFAIVIGVVSVARAAAPRDPQKLVFDADPQLLRGGALLGFGVLLLGAILLLGAPLVEVALDADHVRYVPGGPTTASAVPPAQSGAPASPTGSASPVPSGNGGPSMSPTSSSGTEVLRGPIGPEGPAGKKGCRPGRKAVPDPEKTWRCVRKDLISPSPEVAAAPSPSAGPSPSPGS